MVDSQGCRNDAQDSGFCDFVQEPSPIDGACEGDKHWKKQQVTLPIRLGDVSLVEVGMKAAVSMHAHTELSPQAAEFCPREALRALETDVAVIYSCPITARPLRFSLISGAIRYVPATFPRYHIDLRGSFSDYLRQQFSSKSRATLVRKVNKLAKENRGSLDVRVYKSAEEIEEWHQLARQISNMTYQDRLLKRGLPTDSEFMQSIRRLAREDRFRGYLIFAKGEAIAFLACPILEGGVMSYEHVGHDPRQGKLSPGVVLLYAVLESAFGDPELSIFDFTEGDGIHKNRFATHRLQCGDVWFFVPSARNLMTIGLHASVDQARSVAARILASLGAKDSLRRLIRSWRGFSTA